MKNCFRCLAVLWLALIASSSLAQNTAWPSKPVRLIIPFPPGGPVDFIARLVAQQVQTHTGQTVLVESRVGAGGIIAAEAVIRAAPDGYTLLITGAGGHSIRPSVTNLRFDPVRELPALTPLAVAPQIFVGRANTGMNSLADLVSQAKAQPGKFSFGSIGIGTITQLAGEMLKIKTGIKTVDIPYNGGVPAVQAILGGQIDVLTADLSIVLPHIQGGKLTGLALAGAKRAPQLPALPTAVELGFPDIVADNVYGLFGTGGTPPELLQRINGVFVAAVKSGDYAERLLKAGLVPQGSSREDFEKFIASEAKVWGALAKSLGIRVE